MSLMSFWALNMANGEVEVKFKAYIKGGKHIITIDNDKSLMVMFELNGDGVDHIDLYVDISLLVYVPSDKETITRQCPDESTILNSSLSDNGLFEVEIQYEGSEI